MKTIFITFIFFIFSTAVCLANDNIGLGIIAGEPTGISIKLWTTGNSALDFALAWSFSGDDSLHIHCDYLLHNFNLITVPKGKFPFYYGIGVRIKLIEEDKKNKNEKEKIQLGMRIPLGLAYIFVEQPVDIFIEIVPILDLIPDTEFALNAAIGARYFF